MVLVGIVVMGVGFALGSPVVAVVGLLMVILLGG